MGLARCLWCLLYGIYILLWVVCLRCWVWCLIVAVLIGVTCGLLVGLGLLLIVLVDFMVAYTLTCVVGCCFDVFGGLGLPVLLFRLLGGLVGLRDYCCFNTLLIGGLLGWFVSGVVLGWLLFEFCWFGGIASAVWLGSAAGVWLSCVIFIYGCLDWWLLCRFWCL